jgi:hypothetical protein
VGSTIGILGIFVGVAVVLMRRRDEGSGKDFNQLQLNQEPAQAIPEHAVLAPMADHMAGQEPVQQMQPAVISAPAPVATAPPPPAQPTTVADYAGLPPGGTYDQSTGQTIYIQGDGVRWQMMSDGSFNRL